MTIDGIKVNAKVTKEAVADAVERSITSLESPGFCIACGAEADGVEPDARQYECEACGEFAVYGCEDLLMEFAS